MLRPEHDGCRAGRAQRPPRLGPRNDFPTPDGRYVFYYAGQEELDRSSFRFAEVTDCPLWEHVFAWDKRDVYVLSPQSCGGSGEGCTGFYWKALEVRQPARFRWLPAGYGIDDAHVYNKWHEGPVELASPATFEVVRCGGEDGIDLGRDAGQLYRDGKKVSEQEARAAIAELH